MKGWVGKATAVPSGHTFLCPPLALTSPFTLIIKSVGSCPRGRWLGGEARAGAGAWEMVA